VKIESREERLLVGIALPAQADTTGGRGDDPERRPRRRDESE
jgi:hypothetical protein